MPQINGQEVGIIGYGLMGECMLCSRTRWKKQTKIHD